MKKNCGLLALAMLMACCSFISTKANKHRQIIQLNTNFCQSIGKDPVITICVSGDPGKDKEFNEHLLKNVRLSTKSLVQKYKKSNRLINPKFSVGTCGSQCIYPTDWDPATCGASPPTPPPSACTFTDWNPSTCGATSFCAMYPSDSQCGASPMYCMMHPADPMCMPTTPPSACTFTDWNPTTCGGTSFCAMHPSDSQCLPSPTFCAAHPSAPECGPGSMYCMMYMMDPQCGYAPPPPPPTSACTYYDWDPNVCGGTSFCAMYPAQTICATQSSTCTYGDWDPQLCGAATYCDAYPHQPPCP